MKTKFLAVLLAGAAMAGLTATAANATFIELKVISGATTQISSATFTANDVFTLANTINGVSYTATATGKNSIGHIGLDLSTISHDTTNNVRSVQFKLTMTGIAGDPTLKDFFDAFSGVNSAINPTHPGSDGAKKVYVDYTNIAFGTQHLIYDSGFVCGTTASYSCSGTAPISLLVSHYSVTEVLTVDYKANTAGKTVTSLDRFAAIPEPTSLALLGSGLLFAGWMSRRRRNKTDQTVA